MKTLMLGWEFPPELSGGLGTACQGLARGLTELGAHVTMVLPTLSGEESAPGTELVATDTLPVGRLRARRRYLQDAGSLAGDAPAGEAARRSLEVLTVASPLRPYLSAAGYARRLAAVRKGLPPESADAAEPAPENQPIHGRRDPYGPDLFAEVHRYAEAVGELAGSERFDVVHAHDWMTYPAGLRAKATSGRPLVVHVHSCEFDRAGNEPDERIRQVEQIGFEAADSIVCVSRYTAERVAQRYEIDSAKLRVVHNGVEHARLSAAPGVPDAAEGPRSLEPRAPEDREPLVLFLGRLTWQKGIDFLLAAARRVVGHDPRIRFVVCGDGDLLPATIERAARMRLARHVHFTRFLGREEVNALLDRAAAVVMPSVSEPFGLVALEAAVAGVPVVVSRQSGVSEVLRNGLRVDFWKVDDLAEKILALVRRPALRVALTEGAADEARRLSWQRSALVLLGAYSEVVP